MLMWKIVGVSKASVLYIYIDKLMQISYHFVLTKIQKLQN